MRRPHPSVVTDPARFMTMTIVHAPANMTAIHLAKMVEMFLLGRVDWLSFIRSIPLLARRTIALTRASPRRESGAAASGAVVRRIVT